MAFKRQKFPISLKIVSVTFVILAMVTGTVAFVSFQGHVELSMKREKNAVEFFAQSKAEELRTLLSGYIDKTRLISSFLSSEDSSAEERRKLINESFRKDEDLVSLTIYKNENGQLKRFERVVNETYLKSFGMKESFIDVIRQKWLFFHESAALNRVFLKNTSVTGQIPLISLSIPFQWNSQGEVERVAVADINIEKIQASLSGEINDRKTFAVDSEGVYLGHSQDVKVASGGNARENSAWRAAKTNAQFLSRVLSYEKQDGESWVGAFSRSILGVIVIAEIPESKIIEKAIIGTRKGIVIAGIVTSLSIFFIFLFSGTLSQPIEKLTSLAKEIARGNYSVSARGISSKDEVGELAKTFEHMVQGLREREKMHSVLKKFHGNDVADNLIEKDLVLGGQTKNVAVLFVDLRNFTRFSEGKEPSEVVDMLNEYFKVMVRIINRNGGTVDKFIGDSIMAVWGTSRESKGDIQSALKACMEMRIALVSLNEKRAKRSLDPILMGMGLHYGEVISGNIGSEERMEYTIIGDTVNVASRIEESTKVFGVDLLVSATVAEEGGKHFLIEKVGVAEVKGKAESIHLYKVNGYYDRKQGEVQVKTSYSEFDQGQAGKVKIA